MLKTLVIVESPAKAKSISKFLGKKYVIKASMGHLRDLPKSQLGIDVEHDFEPKYIAIRGKGDLIKELRQSAKTADKVLLASDPDREGEAIAWHLGHLLGLDEHEACRIEFHEITKQAVEAAIHNARQVDMKRVDAQQARRVLDRLIGYQLSPLLWRKVKKGLSGGRVQSVAVRIICDREDEIRVFAAEEYWSIDALLSTSEGQFLAKLVKMHNKKAEIHSREQAELILKELKQSTFTVSDVRIKEKLRNPASPFTTSSLQQEASRKLNFSPRKTMMVAQQLYEGVELGKRGSVGLITYMRTDSVHIAEPAQQEAKEYIVEHYGAPYYPKTARHYTSKGRAQEAHEAIRPTSVVQTPQSVKEYLSREQLRLYRLIWERFLSSQMSSAVLDTMTVEVQAGVYLLRANTSAVKFPGYQAVYQDSREDEVDEENTRIDIIVQKGDAVNLQKLTEKQHFTEPPPRYTEAMLVRKLEEEGIGRPSTYAPTIGTIQSRGYVAKEGKQLIPTELGEIVIALLKEHFPNIVNVEFTAKMENLLDNVEEGDSPWKNIIRDFYGPFEATLIEAENKIGKVRIEDEVSAEICERCGRNMVIKMGKFGKFLACPGFPECRNTKPLLEEIDAQCPLCGSAIVVRRSKKGRKFFGCRAYPECNFLSWDMPASDPCPKCGQLRVIKSSRNQKRIVCTNDQCRYSETIEKTGEADQHA
ncbi:MAG: type I DNA topoisomerase [Peptococcaceae bacterium]|nr:type I DNA topoisomerase [Peptococcaceae bacterium]